MLIFCLLLLVSLSCAGKAPARIDLRSEYTPKHWKLIPRTVEVGADKLLPPLGLTPDDFFAFIPPYVGSVIPGKPFTWTSPCFQNNTATLTVDGNSSMTLTISNQKKKAWFCDDGYLIGYVASFDIRYFSEDWFEHKITFQGGWSEAELYDINNRGLRFFRFPDGVAATADEMVETVMLFFGAMIGAHVPEWTAEDNLEFLKDHMGVTMAERPIQRVNIDKSQVKSGDFLGIIRLDGLDPMLAWAMGSHTGHTAITMWENGELYVMESTIKQSYWPTNGIQKTPWDTWLDQAQNANFNVVHLPLSPKVAAQFDVKAALDFFKTVEGLPYGFHNQFTGWIDTREGNFPGNLTSKLAELLMPFGDWLLRKELGAGQTFDFLRQGLNKRLGTTGLSIVEAYMEASKRDISLMDMVTMPELDSWIFHNDPPMRDGPSMVCDVFVMRMWKAGKLFGNLTNLIEAAEFTNWDAYTLNLFDGNYKRPQICVQADPDSQFCQLLGKYRMSLPGYNTVTPYAHMRERCPTKPPKYIKPVGC